MDPLSITAGTIAILGAIAGTGKGISRLVAFRHAPEELQALCKEAESLKDALAGIRTSLLQVRGTRAYEEHSDTLGTPSTAVNEAVLELEKKIEYQLRRSEETDGQGRPKVSRSEWHRAEPEIRRLKDKIRDSRSNLDLEMSALAVHLMYVGNYSHQASFLPLHRQPEQETRGQECGIALRQLT